MLPLNNPPGGGSGGTGDVDLTDYAKFSEDATFSAGLGVTGPESAGVSLALTSTSVASNAKNYLIVADKRGAIDILMQNADGSWDTLFQLERTSFSVNQAAAWFAGTLGFGGDLIPTKSGLALGQDETPLADVKTEKLNGNDITNGISFEMSVKAMAAMPAHYARDILGSVAGSSVAADRRTYLTPNRVTANIADSGYYLAGQQALDLNVAANWDTTTPDYTNPANRAGMDIYRYAVNNGGALKVILSANSTYPSGYTASTSRKIGGFLCVPLSYGAISGHTLTGFITGDIIPGTIWDLKHLPDCASPEGMTYDAGIRLWADVFGNSFVGGKLVSTFGGTLVDGTSSPALHWNKGAQLLAAVGKRPPWHHEFQYLSLGSNQGTNISTSADPNMAGAFVDTSGRRMVANNGCEMMAGGMWWWALDMASSGTSSWKNGFDGNDSGVAGQMYMEPNRALVGGPWSNGAICGSRALLVYYGPLALAANFGVRGVAEPLAV
jgi:hypothetical protein